MIGNEYDIGGMLNHGLLDSCSRQVRIRHAVLHIETGVVDGQLLKVDSVLQINRELALRMQNFRKIIRKNQDSLWLLTKSGTLFSYQLYQLVNESLDKYAEGILEWAVAEDGSCGGVQRNLVTGELRGLLIQGTGAKPRAVWDGLPHKLSLSAPSNVQRHD
jgi:histone H3/H4